MSDISMIGLGAMGSALAKAQLKAKHSITVWNRSPQKMDRLVELGGKAAASVSQAVQASPLIIVCINNYSVTKQLLGTDDVIRHLAGRTLIQLSTGTPREARECEAWVKGCGGDYLDGAIEPYPESLARNMLLFSRACVFLRLGGGRAAMLAHRKRRPTRSGGKHKPARRVGVCRPTAALRPLADAGASPRGPRLAFDSANANENSNIFRARL